MDHPLEVMGDVIEFVAVKNGWCGQIVVKSTAVVVTRLPAHFIELNFQIRQSSTFPYSGHAVGTHAVANRTMGEKT
jgi:hypothetical protein